MRFRPCIDIHDGKVKQIVGGSLRDSQAASVKENFVSKMDAAFYAKMYRDGGLRGGHAILLNKAGTKEYEADKQQAFTAFSAYPKGLQAGGGITDENAEEFLNAGASHVIVTSYVFSDGKVNFERLEKLSKQVGREHLVLDLSCRKKGDAYVIVTDRWQKETDTVLCMETLSLLASYCDEFLVHAVDVEGKARGIEEELAGLLGEFAEKEGFPVVYAGGVGCFEDLQKLKELGRDRVDVTIGSALDIFGGNMPYEKVLEFCGSSAVMGL